MEQYRVVFSADENFVNYLGVVIQSVLDNTNPDKKYIISVLSDNLSDKSYEFLNSFNRDNFKIEIYNVKEDIKRLNITGLHPSMHWSLATYYRILIPFLFKNDKKVLYLDCDMIVLDDIAKLFDIDLQGAKIAAVSDYDVDYYKEKRILYMQNELKLQNYKTYFNAGLVLFNIEAINKDEYLKEFLNYSKKNYLFADQDILNMIFENNVKLLPKEWNVQYHVIFPELKSHYNMKLDKPKVIHYTTDKKPWNSPEYPMCYYWWQYARKISCYEEIIYKNNVVDIALALSCPIKFMYKTSKILSGITFGKTKEFFKTKNKQLKRYIEIIRRTK